MRRVALAGLALLLGLATVCALATIEVSRSVDLGALIEEEVRE